MRERIVAAIGERTRAIVICSPNNPTGRVLAREQAEILVRALEARAGEPIWLIHDEIYREQTFVEDEACPWPNAIRTRSSPTRSARAMRLPGCVSAGCIAPPNLHRAGDQSARLADVVYRHLRAARRAARLHELGGVNEHVSWYRASVGRGRRGAGGQRLAVHHGPREAFMRACVCRMALVRSTPRCTDRRARRARDSRLAFGAVVRGLAALELGRPDRPRREGIKRIAAYCKEYV